MGIELRPKSKEQGKESKGLDDNFQNIMFSP